MSPRDFDDETRQTDNAPGALGVGGLALLIIGEQGVTQVPLPPSGQVDVGRSRDCAVRVADHDVSRRHLVLHLGAETYVEDLMSRNGTRVGDRRLTPGERIPVGIGEVIGIGSSQLILQQMPARARPRRLWSHDYFEGRVEDECARAEAGGRGFAVLRVRTHNLADTGHVEQLLDDLLRPMDVLAAYAPGDYEALLVDTDADAAEWLGVDLSRQAELAGVTLRVGTAAYGRDGTTPDALNASAGRRVRGEAAASTDIVVSEGALARLQPVIERIARSMINCIVLGETGAGKGVMAQTLHRLSPRASKPFLAINCAALSESLLESELFGYERGAFTGAQNAKPGLLETAQGGTVFLDEIGEMPLGIQAKLLKVIEEREVMRLGALRPRPIDVRFIAATNRDLEQQVAENKFRQDLFFRLNGISLVIPPLRERTDEIEKLAKAFLAEASARAGRKEAMRFSPEAMVLLRRYSWPGNIRELRNIVERASLLCTGDVVLPEHLPREKMIPPVLRRTGRFPIIPTHGRPMPLHHPIERTPPPGDITMPGLRSGDITSPGLRPGDITQSGMRSGDITHSGVRSGDITHSGMRPQPAAPNAPTSEMSTRSAPAPTDADEERQRIIEALEKCDGNQTRAAEMLGISRRTLVYRLQAYALPRPRKK